MELDTSSPSYKTDIFSLANEEATLASRMTIEKGEMRFNMDSLLSPEQRQNFAQMRARKSEMKQRMRQRMHQGNPSMGIPNMGMPQMRMPTIGNPPLSMPQMEKPTAPAASTTEETSTIEETPPKSE